MGGRAAGSVRSRPKSLTRLGLPLGPRAMACAQLSPATLLLYVCRFASSHGPLQLSLLCPFCPCPGYGCLVQRMPFGFTLGRFVLFK